MISIPPKKIFGHHLISKYHFMKCATNVNYINFINLKITKIFKKLESFLQIVNDFWIILHNVIVNIHYFIMFEKIGEW